MNATRFSQPNVAHALCLALAKMHDGATVLSPRILAEAVVPKFPDVPLPALCVIAATVLRLYFEPATIPDIADAGLDLAEEATACKFFGAALKAEADDLAQYRDRRDGSNVAILSPRVTP
jgi:hypothetical protein